MTTPAGNLNPTPVSSNAAQRAALAAYFNGAGNGAVLNSTPYSNAVAVTPATPLSAFTASTFTGALSQQASPGTPYFDVATQKNRVSGGSLTFQGTNGQQQSMSNILVGPITMAGNLTATVTAAGMEDSPVAVSVAVLTTDTNAQLATKTAAALNADEDVSTFFTATAIGNKVIMTRLVAAANDATMNLALANGTTTGLTAEPTATQITAGVAPGTFTSDNISGIFCTGVDGTLVTAFPAGATYPISSVGQGITFDIDIPYGS